MNRHLQGQRERLQLLELINSRSNSNIAVPPDHSCVKANDMPGSFCSACHFGPYAVIQEMKIVAEMRMATDALKGESCIR